jgi:hypothetical protein
MTTIKDEWLQRDMEAFFKARADLLAGIVTLTPTELADALLAFFKVLRAGGDKMPDARFKMLLEEYTATLRQPRQNADELAAPRYNGVVVRAACRSGVLTGVEESAVGDMTPLEVRDLATEINSAWVAAYEVPGE